jgi:dephospho-CoA kinase
VSAERVLVGLTGGLAAGKSTVARLLAERGCTVVDADRLVAEIYRPGEPGARAVHELFGADLLDAQGAVDHRALAARVFTDAEARRQLEAAIHPLVRTRFERIAKQSRGIVVCEATLLVEAGWAGHFDLVVTVEAPPALQLERAVARGLSRTEAERRLAAQGDGAARRAAATRVLVNDDDLVALANAVDALVRDLRRLLAKRESAGSGSQRQG